ncbi:MAG: tetratricopeptide repeat protein [Gemmatimonadales bacterium]
MLTNLGPSSPSGATGPVPWRATTGRFWLTPTLAEAWLNRGTALHQAGRPGEHESLVRAAALDPGPKARTALGVVEAEQGDLARAAPSHEDAIRRDPGYPDAHWNLALAPLGGGELARGWGGIRMALARLECGRRSSVVSLAGVGRESARGSPHSGVAGARYWR